jgi:hypothetical protein
MTLLSERHAYTKHRTGPAGRLGSTQTVEPDPNPQHQRRTEEGGHKAALLTMPLDKPLSISAALWTGWRRHGFITDHTDARAVVEREHRLI